MSTTTRATLRTTRTAILAMLVFTLLLGVVYPAAVTAIGQLALPWQANGSLVRDADDEVVGSALIGQSFADAEGVPLPQYFQSRPSAAFVDDNGHLVSGGSNYGPENETLLGEIADRQAAISALEGVEASQIPVDAVTASGSGLDPHISPAYARLQVPRIAEERGLDEAQVSALVESRIQSRDLGFLGEPRVNVLELNLALDALAR
ncbi:potassium-transporting ATPase subunit KdpC [Microbacterium sp. JZ31]|uniref:potassium-transporting ATPase subunit KdpC n=1 Tax=Microbacterium sp. JZ31 TaxID=1906274 RepID=UPI0019338827|nr:potassium-transporting ATPase subunit KdpC [Microbacterium sp. JZ31]